MEMNRTMTARDHILALLDEDEAELEPFRWTITSEYYKEGSSDPWRTDTQTGVIRAAIQAEAIIKLITGHGIDTEANNPEINYDGEVTITVVPVWREQEARYPAPVIDHPDAR